MREGELLFDFGTAKVERLDDRGKTRPQKMQLVDFIIEEAKRIIMLEIKDPSCQSKGGNAKAEAALMKERGKFIQKLAGDELIADELTPKARDSYTYLHLMERDSKPIIFAFLLGADHLPIEPALLLAFKDRLFGRLRQETDQPWARKYVNSCLVLTENTWPSAFPTYSLTRTADMP